MDGTGSLFQPVAGSSSSISGGSWPASEVETWTSGGTPSWTAGSRSSKPRSSIQNDPLPPSPDEIANSMAPTCFGSRVFEGPQARLSLDFRMVTGCQSVGKEKSRWFRHQTLLPVGSRSLNSKLFRRPSPRREKVKA